ncbi:MAG: hypothetical protein LBE12_04180 [Planctomycetaceae bacterium]|jgi:uncharacterized phage-associated protein|nr:hypothetical protein [Planctomycetaceae bacterium]
MATTTLDDFDLDDLDLDAIDLNRLDTDILSFLESEYPGDKIILPPATDVFAVANWFIEKADKERRALTLSRLQSLSYLAYGWFLVYSEGTPLFDADIIATPQDLIIPVLRRKFRECAGRFINKYAEVFQDDKEEVLRHSIQTSDKRELIESILEEVWDAYSRWSWTRLKLFIYRNKSPLGKICDISLELERFPFCVRLTPEILRGYFTALLEEYNYQAEYEESDGEDDEEDGEEDDEEIGEEPCEEGASGRADGIADTFRGCP